MNGGNFHHLCLNIIHDKKVLEKSKRSYGQGIDVVGLCVETKVY